MANLLTSWQRYDKQYVQTLIVGSKCSSRSADSNLGATAFKKGSAVKVVRGGSSGSYTYTITDCTVLTDADYVVASDYAVGDKRIEVYPVKDITNLV